MASTQSLLQSPKLPQQSNRPKSSVVKAVGSMATGVHQTEQLAGEGDVTSPAAMNPTTRT
jgi:hypothetical protein